MNTWKFYGITHADHVVCNPTSTERLDELIGLLDLEPGASVWEAACGKGELLVRLAERRRLAGPASTCRRTRSPSPASAPRRAPRPRS